VDRYSLSVDRVSPVKKSSLAILEVTDLVKYFAITRGVLQRNVGWVKAVDDVSFTINEGETLGLIGESGCGKTTAGRSILRLIDPTSGTIRFLGQNVNELKGSELKDLRLSMQIIFQDPFSSLNPRLPIGISITEGLSNYKIGSAKERKAALQEILRHVGLEPYHASRYPHQFSGGQRQRIGIARALIVRPKFVVCDEPVSALYLSIQAQVLNLLQDLQDKFHLTYLFIAHNMSVIKHVADRIAVMYLGKIVEIAGKEVLFANPTHPYTKALMSAIPIPNPHLKKERIILQGDVPSPVNPPSGCRFHPRCPIAFDRCSQEEPKLSELEAFHSVACWDAFK
jgi:peptide/nickel transport system ATP-binding protein/oligopeptide transport system ATP-binding protein